MQSWPHYSICRLLGEKPFFLAFVVCSRSWRNLHSHVVRVFFIVVTPFSGSTKFSRFKVYVMRYKHLFIYRINRYVIEYVNLLRLSGRHHTNVRVNIYIVGALWRLAIHKNVYFHQRFYHPFQRKAWDKGRLPPAAHWACWRPLVEYSIHTPAAYYVVAFLADIGVSSNFHAN